MVTVTYTTNVPWIFGFDLSRTRCHTLILDVFRLFRPSLCICVVCKCNFVVNRMFVCCFIVSAYLVTSFFFSGFAIGGLRGFSCFVSFIFIILLMLLLSFVYYIVCVCDFVHGCILVWVYFWFAKILVDVFKLSCTFQWHFFW